jgi:hypothetical protein
MCQTTVFQFHSGTLSVGIVSITIDQCPIGFTGQSAEIVVFESDGIKGEAIVEFFDYPTLG